MHSMFLHLDFAAIDGCAMLYSYDLERVALSIPTSSVHLRFGKFGKSPLRRYGSEI